MQKANNPVLPHTPNLMNTPVTSSKDLLATFGMPPALKRLSTGLLTLGFSTLFAGMASAASLTWGSGGGGGDGTWDLSASNWFLSGSGTAWTDGNEAVFGGDTGGVVTMGAAVSATKLTFNAPTTGNYTLSGSGANVLSLGAFGLVINSGTVTLNLGVNRTVAQTWTVSTGALLNFSGTTSENRDLTISGNGNTVLSGTVYVNRFNVNGASGGTGTVTVQGGSFSSGNFEVGNNGKGVFNVTGGSAAGRVSLEVGKGSASSVGVINQSGGTMTGGGSVLLGIASSGFGAYNLTSGTFISGNNGDRMEIGQNSSGVWVQTGGQATINGPLFIGRNSNSTGVATVAGGTFASTHASGMVLGGTGSGILNVRGTGFVNLGTSNLTFTSGTTTTSNYGIANLQGGVLAAGGIVKTGSGSATLNFNGGTLRATKTNTAFLTGLNQAYVYSGGANIDTNGFDITVGQSLLAASGTGVSSIPITAGGSGYLSAPMVTISGGGGSGATAIATIDANGTVTGITITNPGMGYTGAPTITIAGAGGSGATVGTIALAENTSGGLTKTGNGALILTANNTYGGITTISNGTLQLGNGGTTGWIPMADLTNHGTLAFNRSDDITWSAVVSGSGGLRQSGPGTLTLTGSNTYSGVTTIAGGTLQVGNGGTVGSLGSGSITNNGALVFNRSNAETVASSISGTGVLTKNGGSSLSLSGTNSNYSGGTIVNSGTLILSGVDNGKSAVGSGTLTINAGAKVVMTSPNTLGWGHDLAITPAVVVNSGVLDGGSNWAALKSITLNSGTLTRSWQYWGFNQPGTIAASGTSVISGGAINLRPAGGANMPFDVAAGGVLNISSSLQNDLGTAGFAKTGAGKMVLNADNSYKGTTLVNQGTLVINGNNAGATGEVRVAAGATLMGSGTVGGATTISGVHSPGNSPGLQTFTNGLTYENGSSVVWELSANTTADRGLKFDGINVSGTLAFTASTTLTLSFNGSGSTVDWNGSLWDASITGTNGWLIYSGASSLTGIENLSIGAYAGLLDANNVAFGTANPGGSFTIYQDNNNLYLNYVVPEPSSFAFMVGGFGMLLGIQRMRKKRVGTVKGAHP